MKNENIANGLTTDKKFRELIGSDGIIRLYITTALGNEIALFYNPKLDLVTLDLVDGDERGGNELFRMYMDERKLLEHLMVDDV